jgi:mevalonate kinase
MSQELLQRYYSSGKLLITGEYMVLHGALSLALPTRAGQALSIYKSGDKELVWNTTVLSKPWFHCRFSTNDLKILETDRAEIAKKLQLMLRAAAGLKGDTEWLRGVRANADLEFDIEWGLGSSSSLISNIAWWSDTDPFLLSSGISQGSGYDIASARSGVPILYKVEKEGTKTDKVMFLPAFADNLAFVYLGKKQDSSSSVKNFLTHALVKEKDITRISEITRQVVLAEDLKEYKSLLTQHEEILSRVLDRPPVKEVLFRDYPGMVKSLGAWGGDFVHVSMDRGMNIAREYFAGKGLNVFIPFREMIKKIPDEK